MKKQLQAIFILFMASQSLAQNLVTNNSFETYFPCPSTTSSIANATGWSTSQNSPDYFNACANTTNPDVGVPSNICGCPNAATGNAYIGLLGYGSFSPNLIVNNREYATGTLSQPLTVGIKYYVSFKAVLMNMSSHAINNMGAKFLMNPGPLPITNSAQVYTTAVISDTLNWTLIQGSFIADSNYNYITIGNHFTDANSTVVPIQPVIFGWNAYYFIEDVCVSQDSLTCFPIVGINELAHVSDAGMFPNPFNDKLTIRGSNLTEIILYDLSSRKLLHEQFKNTVTLNTAQLAKGMYIYEVRNKNGVVRKGKVVKE